jgi:hypothetical protein
MTKYDYRLLLVVDNQDQIYLSMYDLEKLTLISTIRYPDAFDSGFVIWDVSSFLQQIQVEHDLNCDRAATMQSLAKTSKYLVDLMNQTR